MGFFHLPGLQDDPIGPGYVLRFRSSSDLTPGAEVPVHHESLLWKFHQAHLKELSRANEAIAEKLDSVSPRTCPIGLPRLAWEPIGRVDKTKPVTVQSRTGTGEYVVTNLREASSVYDFFTCWDQVYLRGEDGELLARNLAVRQSATVSPSISGVYQIPGEVSGLIPDSDVAYKDEANTWWRIPAGDPRIDWLNATITLTGSRESLVFLYGSADAASSIAISVSGFAFEEPVVRDLWNYWDELGLRYLLPRFAGEHNLSYRRRLIAKAECPIYPDTNAPSRNMAAELDLIEFLPWGGTSTLNITASGLSMGLTRAVDAMVASMPSTGVAFEELVPLDRATGTFSSSKTDWLSPYEILVDGRPAAPRYTPIVSGALVFFNTALPTETVTARYRFIRWTASNPGGDGIIGIVPTTNAVSGDYTVVLTRDISIYSPSLPSVREDKLLTPAGLANALFYNVAEILLSRSNEHTSRAAWGNFISHDPSNEVTYLPIPLDL